MEREDIIKVLEDVIKDVKKYDDISLHYITLLLKYSLKGVKDKKDLYPIDIIDIKSIRELIKGL